MSIPVLLLALAVVPAADAAAPAQTSTPAGAVAPSPAAMAAMAAPAGAAPAPRPVPVLTVPAAAAAGPGFDVERATEAWLATIPAETRARSDAYFEGGYWLILWRALVGLAAARILLATGLSARLRALAERVTGVRWVWTAIYGAALVVALSVLTFPLELYAGFFRERAYGLLNQDLGAWLGDQLKALAVSVVVGAAFVAVLYAAIRRAPHRWWAWGAGIAVAFVVVGMALAPVYVMPLFNEYRPLPAGAIRDDLLTMARANGVPARDVFVYDGSRQTNRVTANVSGFASTLRISASDTLLDRSPPETVRAVIGHELGHYLLGHTVVLIVELGLVIVAGFAVVAWGLRRVLGRWGARWGVRDAADPAGAPALWSLFAIFMFVATPVTNCIIRTHEVEADLFGLNVAREPDGFAYAAAQLSEYRKMSPGPLEEIVFYDHPSGRARVRMAMQWKAEHLADRCAAPAGGGREEVGESARPER